MKKEQRYTALYERLSHDDELQGESNSISNQDSICQGDFLRIHTEFPYHNKKRGGGTLNTVALFFVLADLASCFSFDSEYNQRCQSSTGGAHQRDPQTHMTVIPSDGAGGGTAADRKLRKCAAVDCDDLDGMLACGQGIQIPRMKSDRQRLP